MSQIKHVDIERLST